MYVFIYTVSRPSGAQPLRQGLCQGLQADPGHRGSSVNDGPRTVRLSPGFRAGFRVSGGEEQGASLPDVRSSFEAG